MVKKKLRVEKKKTISIKYNIPIIYIQFAYENSIYKA